MFRKLYNQALVSGWLRPSGPLLIARGGTSLDPTAPDLAFVRTTRAGESTVYLPGASIKGVLRAHAERILATEVGPHAAEDPFREGHRRQEARETRKDGTEGVYRLSCEADRLFGSTEIAGRLRVADAHPTQESVATANRTEIRYGVAIDRAKQSVAVGPFEQEAVVEGDFELRVSLENFELWMLALTLQVLRDLHDGLIQVGHAKSRGFGSVTIEQPALVLRWPGAAPSRLEGAGARETSEELRSKYGLATPDSAELPAGGQDVVTGFFSGYRYTGWAALEGVLTTLAEGPWSSFVARAGGAGGSGVASNSH